MFNSRTSHGHNNLAGIVFPCWLLTNFLFMHQHTVPRVVNPGKTALVTALVTANVSSRLTSLLRLVGHHENRHHETHLDMLTAITPLDEANSI